MATGSSSILSKVFASAAALSVCLGIAACAWQRNGQSPVKWASDAEAFEKGSIGTEFAPLVAMDVLPDLFPEYFQPQGVNSGDWITQLGLNKSPDPASADHAPLPRGFTVSSLQPVSGAASPVPFVGIGCAGCHTNTMLINGNSIQILGGGGASVNIIAFSEALRAAILDQRLTTSAIDDARRRKGLQPLCLIERFVVSEWIKAFRAAALADATKYDTPFTDHILQSSQVYPAGPGRTRAFRSLVRVVLDRPGEMNHAITKIPAIYSQRLRPVAQFDGSISDHDSRSALAALTAGATPQALATRQISDNIRRTSRFTAQLDPPAWERVVAAPLNPEMVARGRISYMNHCFECHGGPDAARQWLNGPKHASIIPLDLIGTDPGRVNFPHAQELVVQLNKFLPPGHPFHPGDKIRTTNGYVCSPIDGAFSRAPYLHNGSILTLAELLNLEPRRPVFFRGQNPFDPARVGLQSPSEAEWLADPELQRKFPFRFEADPARGNSIAGHDYPWPRDQVPPGSERERELRDLLEYLKTL